MMCNNPNVDLVNMNAYIMFGEILSICSQDIERKRNLGLNQGRIKVQKMTASNSNIDLVSINSFIKFGQNLSICSQDIKPKQNFGVNQGP